MPPVQAPRFPPWQIAAGLLAWGVILGAVAALVVWWPWAGAALTAANLLGYLFLAGRGRATASGR